MKLATMTFHQALGILKHHESQLYQEFRLWYGSKGFSRPLVEAVANLQEQTFRLFVRQSSHLADVDFPLTPETTIPGLGCTFPPIPKEDTPSTPPRTEKEKEPEPEPAPMPETPVEQPQPKSASNNPLIDALIKELNAAGFAPGNGANPEAVDRAIDARIADIKAAHTMRVEIHHNGITRTITGRMPYWYARLEKIVAARRPALLVGPAGCGKTTAVEKMAESMQLPFYRLSMAAGTDEGTLQGWLLPQEGLKMDYVPSSVVTAYEQGGVVLLDDIDLSDANMLGIMNAALDNSSWHVHLRYGMPQLSRSEDFIIVAAANTWGHGADRRYVGANQLDERTLSRFRQGQIPCDYDRELERELFRPETCDFGHTIRERCNAASLPRNVSTRDLDGADALVSVGMSVSESWYGYFSDWKAKELEAVHVVVDHDSMSVEVR